MDRWRQGRQSFVTAAVTAETLRLHRGLAVEKHRAAAIRLNRLLTMSPRLTEVDAAMLKALEQAERRDRAFALHS